MLQGRLDNLKKRHKRAGGQHTAQDADKKTKPVSAGVLPNTSVGFSHSIIPVKKFLLVSYLMVFCHDIKFRLCF